MFERPTRQPRTGKAVDLDSPEPQGCPLAGDVAVGAGKTLSGAGEAEFGRRYNCASTWCGDCPETQEIEQYVRAKFKPEDRACISASQAIASCLPTSSR